MVNTHRQRILRKLNVNSTIEAVRYAEKLGGGWKKRRSGLTQNSAGTSSCSISDVPAPTL
ncbi:MAG: hypothetical protein LUF90_06085 [Rikenellaceae bacterium]|nr:hypothetical protein [Rikenellaceae bacterium]